VEWTAKRSVVQVQASVTAGHTDQKDDMAVASPTPTRQQLKEAMQMVADNWQSK
jgi:hypothetical protein